MELLQQGLSLIAVFGLIGGALWFVKARSQPGLRFGIQKGERAIQVVDRVALTAQHTLCLVRVGQREVLIGTAPTQCHLIQTIEDRSQ